MREGHKQHLQKRILRNSQNLTVKHDTVVFSEGVGEDMITGIGLTDTLLGEGPLLGPRQRH